MQTKKKLSQKQIFRTLIFQYHLQKTIPLQLLASIISTLYYPLDTSNLIKPKYSLILLTFMKQFTSHNHQFTQQQFVIFMKQLQKHNHQEYSKKICQRIFNRYRKQNSNVIDQDGWRRLAKAFKLQQDEVSKCFFDVADRTNQITKERFLGWIQGK